MICNGHALGFSYTRHVENICRFSLAASVSARSRLITTLVYIYSAAFPASNCWYIHIITPSVPSTSLLAKVRHRRLIHYRQVTLPPSRRSSQAQVQALHGSHAHEEEEEKKNISVYLESINNHPWLGSTQASPQVKKKKEPTLPSQLRPWTSDPHHERR